jgi:hypothetical protein
MDLLWAAVLLLPAAAIAAAPQEGAPVQVRRGLFTETDIGLFLTVGGDDRYSNAQTYLQLGVGYDVGDRVELGAHFGLGASAANCFAGRIAGVCRQADNFTVVFLNLSATYLARLAERLYLTPKLTGGYAALDPAPLNSSSDRPVRSGANLGGGIGLEYATSMDHFSIGADCLVRYIFSANISTIAVVPRVKYTF